MNAKENNKKYYIYAGYWELLISDVELGAPLTYQGEVNSLGDAIDFIMEEFDETICYSESLRSEVADFFGAWDEEDLNRFPFFNEQKYKLTA